MGERQTRQAFPHIIKEPAFPLQRDDDDEEWVEVEVENASTRAPIMPSRPPSSLQYEYMSDLNDVISYEKSTVLYSMVLDSSLRR